MITTNEKQNVRNTLEIYCQKRGGQNKAANSLNGVSAATVSQILNGNWQLVSDDMWRNISVQIGIKPGEWKIVETVNFGELTTMFSDAQDEAFMMAICGEAGCGKTVAAREFERSGKNVYLLSCSDYWNRKIFLQELLKELGRPLGGDFVSDMIDDVVLTIKRQPHPLVIIDEADKLNDKVLSFFIDLYNDLEDYCGIILMATDHLEKKIKRGYRLNKQGYKEIFSRIGRKCVPLTGVTRQDIEDVCLANGITGKQVIKDVVTDCEGDLRRVKRKCRAIAKQRS